MAQQRFHFPACEFSEWRIRARPSLDAHEVGFILANQVVDVLEQDSEWLRVRSGDVEGWMLAVVDGRRFLHPVRECTAAVDLAAVLEGAAQEVVALDGALVERGWCFVELAPYLRDAGAALLRATLKFFQASDAHKRSFHFPPRYGYVKAADRESFRLLTGEMATAALLPPEIAKETLHLSRIFDLLGAQIVDVLAQPVFGASLEQIGTQGKLPLLRDGAQGYGMLDVVAYCGSDAAPFHCGSDGGNHWPISPSASAPKIASVSACMPTSASEWPERPRPKGRDTPQSVT